VSIERLLSEQKAMLKLGSTLANKKKAYPNGDTLVSVRGEEYMEKASSSSATSKFLLFL
jgi:hypothetical protein